MLDHHHSPIRTWYLWLMLMLIVVLGLLVSGCNGQAAPKTYRVGVLSGLNFLADITDGFKAEMTKLGYTEGQNITYDVQKTDFDMAAYKRILQKFVDDKVDLILVFPTEASMEAKAATQGTNIPVVFTFALVDGMGVINSVREPGGNITGVRYPGPDVVLKRFEIMRQLAPQAKRMLIPYQKDYPIVDPQLEVLRAAAKSAGITLIEVPAADAAELESALQARAKEADFGVDAVLLIVEPLTVTPDTFAIIGKFAAEYKAPVGGALIWVREYHSIFGVNVDPVKSGQQAASLADKIFKGGQAGTIPVVSAETFLQIDYSAAQEQGVTVPEGLLNQADEVIK